MPNNDLALKLSVLARVCVWGLVLVCMLFVLLRSEGTSIRDSRGKTYLPGPGQANGEG